MEDMGEVVSTLSDLVASAEQLDLPSSPVVRKKRRLSDIRMRRDSPGLVSNIRMRRAEGNNGGISGVRMKRRLNSYDMSGVRMRRQEDNRPKTRMSEIRMRRQDDSNEDQEDTYLRNKKIPYFWTDIWESSWNNRKTRNSDKNNLIPGQITPRLSRIRMKKRALGLDMNDMEPLNDDNDVDMEQEQTFLPTYYPSEF